LAQGNIFKNFADDRIYDAIQIVLKNQYPDNQAKVQCMVDDFRRNKVADKFYTIDLLTNNEKLSKEIQPYVDEANLKVISSCFCNDLILVWDWEISEVDRCKLKSLIEFNLTNFFHFLSSAH
jgi:hypothetical protein